MIGNYDTMNIPSKFFARVYKSVDGIICFKSDIGVLKDGRTKNGTIEKQRLQWMTQKFNGLIKADDEILYDLLKNIDITMSDILCFQEAGGTNKHFDMVIILKSGISIAIEHKGNVKGKLKNPTDRPWAFQPQLFNAPYNFSKASIIYTKLWFEKYIPRVKNMFQSEITNDILSYNDWVQKDATMGSCQSQWGKNLKELVKNNKNYKRKLAYLVDQSIREYWNIISGSTVLFNILLCDIRNKLQNILKQKNIWLNAYYESSSSIEIETQNITLSKTPYMTCITAHIEQLNNKKPRLILKYKLSSSEKVFTGFALLRWGNGNGIANIRWNIY